MDQPAEAFSLRTLRGAFAPRAEPYSGVVLEEPRRIGGILTLLVTAIIALLAIADPPTEAIGDAGWAIWGAAVAGGAIGGAAMLWDRVHVGFDALFAATCAGVVVIAVLTWLAGGLGSPYQQLYLAPGILPPSIHPPRRALSILVLITVAIFLPLAYDGWDGSAAATIAVEALFIWLLALITMVVINAVREQRLGLIDEGEAASRLARSDALTKLGNRLAFDETLARELARSRRSGAPLSLLILDLDSFKRINDTFGHPTGDKTLRAVATAMSDHVRLPDACFRWGGDEFALLLPDASLERADAVGGRLLESVRSETVLPDRSPVTFTYGVAELRRGEEAAELLARADSALVAAKRSG